MLLVTCDDHPVDRTVKYYDLAEASSIISTNKWGLPTNGISTESLRRAHRESGRQYGTRLGRDVYFTEVDIKAMGYDVDASRVVVAQTIRLQVGEVYEQPTS